MTCITKVSGSGNRRRWPRNTAGTAAHALRHGRQAGDFDGIVGDVQLLKSVEMIDQNPIGKSSRSNPVTYIKAYDEIGETVADQPYAQHTGLGASAFVQHRGRPLRRVSGEGCVIKVSMQFMADVELVCEACGGKRFRDEILKSNTAASRFTTCWR